MTCYTSGDETKIRVQSNSIPDHCFQTHKTIPNVPEYQEVDYEVTWNADMTDFYNYD